MFRGGRVVRGGDPTAGGTSSGTVLDAWGDAACEVLVRGFGTWTVLYHLGVVVGIRTTPLLLLAALLTALPLAVPPLVRRWRARTSLATAAPGTVEVAGADRVPWLRGVFLITSVALAIVAVSALTGPTPSYSLGWGLAVASVVVLILALVVAGPVAEQAPRALAGPGRMVASLVVLGVLATAAVASLYTVTKSYDDVFYVNKAVFVAEQGTIPVRDTVYTDQLLPAIRGAGSVPVQSLEVLQGAVGYALGMSGASAAYLVATPVAVSAAVWVLWWLAREWSRGPAIAAFLVGAAYLTWGMYLVPGAEGSIAVSSLPLRGSWQGKVVLVTVALPFCHLALTRWARGRRPRDLLLLFLVGAGAVGLASTAIFLVPPIAISAAVALAVTRRRGWWGPLALAAYPVGAGVVVAQLSPGEDYGDPLRDAAESFHGLFGQGWWGWLGGLALMLGAWAVRRGAGQVVPAAAVTATVVVLAPFAPQLVDDLTGAGPIVWRLGWIAPLPVLLGVLAAAPLGSPEVLGARVRALVERVPSAARTALGWSVVAATVSCVVLVGRPVWADDAPLRFADRPSWKWTQPELDVAAAIARGARGPGYVLAPREAMSAMALTTTRVHAVDPRSFFLPGLVEDPLVHEARRRLSYSMRSGLTWVYRSFTSDLLVVGVGTVCLDPTQFPARAALESGGWLVNPALDVPGLTCWRAPTAEQGARSPGAR